MAEVFESCEMGSRVLVQERWVFRGYHDLSRECGTLRLALDSVSPRMIPWALAMHSRMDGLPITTGQSVSRNVQFHCLDNLSLLSLPLFPVHFLYFPCY